MQPYPTTQIQHCLERLLAGDARARDDVIQFAYERLRALTHKLLAGYPSVQPWELTDDVLHNAALRLWNSLDEVRPENVPSFFGLAATQIRRELVDLARHYYGPRGQATHFVQLPHDEANSNAPEKADPTDGPCTLSDWTELHEVIERLPDEERAILDLLYYDGITQQQAAAMLGVSLRTVKRRWLRARERVYAAFHSDHNPPLTRCHD